jgi:hypothetical protein
MSVVSLTGSSSLPSGDPMMMNSMGVNSGIGSVQNCSSLFSPTLSYTYPTYPASPVSLRPVLNGFIVTVGYFYSPNGNWPTQGEYVFTDVQEATKFIGACMEKMLPK